MRILHLTPGTGNFHCGSCLRDHALIKALRALPSYKAVPILMLTTESGDAMKAQGKAAGATGWIVKPFDPAKLLEVVKKVLG
jgi:two-component system chemotaxis response regulator CheY